MSRRKNILVPALLFAGVLTAPAYAATDISGTWQLTIAGGNTPSCTLTQKGKALSGTCSAQMSGDAAGSINGKTVKWTWTVSMNGMNFIREFSGQWDLKNTISGNLTFKTDGTPPPGTKINLPPPSTFTAIRQSGK